MIWKMLIIGGTGMLGEPVARRLLKEGYGVRIFTHNPERASRLFPPPYEIAAGDVEQADSLAAALQGCQAVHINLHGAYDPDLERRGAEAVVRVAKQIGLERITYLSGASVCPQNAWFPDTRARLLAEQAIQSSDLPFTIFRADFFMESLPNFVRGKMLLQIGRHPHPYRWLAAGDYANMVAHAYAAEQAAGKILYVGGPQALKMRAALQVLKRVRYPNYSLIYLPLRLAGLIAWLGKRRELQSVLPFFEYCEKLKVFQTGSVDEANALLGAPVTTLELWARSLA